LNKVIFWGLETEAEIARREGRDYETAEVLFGKIKEERRKSGKNDKCRHVIK
jgi:type I restriction enzyme S subunit